MKYAFVICCLFGSLSGNISALKNYDQTFINENILGQGLVFEIMLNNINAIKCVDGHKIYLKSERIVPSESGLMLLGDDDSLTLLPKLYSDQQGCYLKSSLMCASCGNEDSPVLKNHKE